MSERDIVIEAWQAGPSEAATPDSRAAVVAAVRDYFEGWFDGDTARMRRALHPALAKRSFAQDAARTPALAETTATEMVEATAAGAGRARAGGRALDIRVDDIDGGMAAVTARSEHYYEYLHLAATPDGWKIVNTLWRWADGHGPRG
jgi:hypothetical protein